jgi:hypothetical protein
MNFIEKLPSEYTLDWCFVETPLTRHAPMGSGDRAAQVILSSSTILFGPGSDWFPVGSVSRTPTGNLQQSSAVVASCVGWLTDCQHYEPVMPSSCILYTGHWPIGFRLSAADATNVLALGWRGAFLLVGRACTALCHTFPFPPLHGQPTNCTPLGRWKRVTKEFRQTSLLTFVHSSEKASFVRVRLHSHRDSSPQLS